jgi:hypothetical protein
MSDADSPRPIANMQAVVNRTVSAVPTSAYKGSIVGDDKSIWIPLLVVAAVVVVVVVIVLALARG